MALTFTPTTCPTCQGYGLTSTQSGMITCQTCHGAGVWFETDDGKRIVYRLPETIHPNAHQDFQYKKYLQYGLSGLSFAITVITGIILLNNTEGDLINLVWKKSIINGIFGLSGLFSMWGLANWKHHHSSRLSLHDLPAAIEKTESGSEIDLKLYANARLEQLLTQASQIAQEYKMNQIDETLLLLALLKSPRIQVMMARLELSSQSLGEQITQLIQAQNNTNQSAMFFHPSARERIQAGIEEAVSHDFPYIDLEDVFLGYTKTPGQFESLFHDEGLTYDEFYAITRWYAGEEERLRKWAFWLEQGRSRPGGYMNRAWTALPTPFLDQYSTDITRLATNGRVATVTVRDHEIKQVLQVLGRTQKNSVLLVGEPGVGKNSVLGAIALRMIQGDVPEILKDKRLVAMDMSALLSGSESAEENIQHVLHEVEQAGNVILAIPDVQVLVGTSGSALDAAALLSNALTQGLVQLISTASYADYHRYVESNPSLTALLDTVEIKEVNEDQAIEILEEETPVIENRQKVYLTYPALESAVKLAKRYLPDRALPDSAISLLDEAASTVQLNKGRWVFKKDVEKVVEERTNIPVQEASEDEAAKLLNLENLLHEHITGQHEAIVAVSEALRRSRAGLRNEGRPISSFLFVGPTGVGKTETAKAIADVYFGQGENMIRLDMSEYQDAPSVYRLIGAPAADSESYTEGGTLTQPVREHPFSLILLDELEKAYPDVLNLFLQLLDDGRLTENTGRTVHFNNTIIIATSNAGAPKILELLQQGVGGDELRKQMLLILQDHFRPEFINRFDAVVPFQPLTMENVEAITRQLLAAIQEKALEQKIEISFAPDAVTKLAELGFDPLYGARPLRHVVQEKVEGLLAKLILSKQIKAGESLQITAEMIQ